MTITIPSGRTLPLQAKSGGGFASSALSLGGGGGGGIPASPILAQDFENTGLNIGDSIDDNTTLGGSGGVLDDTRAFAGTRSMKITAVQGSSETFSFGYLHNLDRNMLEGEEVWVRHRQFIPEGGSYNSSTGLKFLAVSVEDALGGNRGRIFSLLSPDGSQYAWRFIFEGVNQNADFTTDRSTVPQKGVWETYEFYTKLGTVPESEGGLAVTRLWKNGDLLGEVSNKATLVASDDYAHQVTFITFWNGGSPVDQDWWIDDIVIATSDSPPTESDASGNVFIGAD